MNRYNHQRPLGPKDYVIRTFGAIVMIVVLVYCLPRAGYSKYHYSIGEPWDYSPIIAQDSFPIYKTEAQLQRDHDSLMQVYKPIYELDPMVGSKMISNFLSDFNKQLKKKVPNRYRIRLAERLTKIYNVGIASTDDYNRMKTENPHGILVSTGNDGRERSLTEIYTQKSAYEYLMHDPDTLHYSSADLQECDINKYLKANLTYDQIRSEVQKKNVESNLVRFSGQVVVGQKIVDRGQIVDERTYNVLQSMRKFREGQNRSTGDKVSLLAGQIIYMSLLVMCLLIFFQQFRSDYLDDWRYPLLVIFLTLAFPLLTYLMVSHNLNYVYAIPYCILPIFLRVFLDSRSATLTHTVCVLMSAIVLSSPFEFVCVQLVAGLTAIYSLRELTQRSELFRSVVQVALVSLLCYGCFDLIHMEFTSEEGVNHTPYYCILVNCGLLMISYLLLFPIERIFHFASNVTLVELSNTNNEILRLLSEKAPGTFQHSMQVANLAAEVALSIGAKSQLVRTGALYHDIGKLTHSEYFTENQSGYNPHDRLTLTQSAQIIIDHVHQGLLLAEKYRLPQVIRDFIATHHGKSTTKYFYITWRNQHPNEPDNKKAFTYPGPNPTTLEQAILMMADSVEAASRSLSEYTEESVGNLVDKIVDSQLQDGYFDHCPITLENISTAKEVLKEKLKTIYHTRISYPELKK